MSRSICSTLKYSKVLVQIANFLLLFASMHFHEIDFNRIGVSLLIALVSSTYTWPLKAVLWHWTRIGIEQTHCLPGFCLKLAKNQTLLCPKYITCNRIWWTACVLISLNQMKIKWCWWEMILFIGWPRLLIMTDFIQWVLQRDEMHEFRSCCNDEG